jgi:peptidoglycan glycosyltransferase
MSQLGDNIRRLAYVPVLGFLVLCVFLGYWQVLRADELRDSKYNNRGEQRRRLIKPGRILARDGSVILDSEQGPDGWIRKFADPEVYCHLTGYDYKTGLQRGLQDALTAQGKYEDPWRNLMSGRPSGCDVVLTIDPSAQRIATEAFRGRKGAVVALDPRTGAVLALVSAPAYKPEDVLKDEYSYELFRQNPDSPELCRPLQGLYPPGSVFKVFTAAVGIDLGLTTPKTQYVCTGQLKVDHSVVKCRKPEGHGKLDLTWALADSCNVTFAQVGLKIGPDHYADYIKRFHLLDPSLLPIEGVTGRMADFKGFKGRIQLANAAYGQGLDALTPFSIARMVAAIANKGVAFQPYIVQRIQTPEGTLVEEGGAQSFGQVIQPATARQVTQMMIDVVEKGTGRRVRISGVKIAGKTGSAENPHGQSHAWFVAFAPADDPQVAIAVVVENAGAGGEIAAPIARDVMRALLKAAS